MKVEQNGNPSNEPAAVSSSSELPKLNPDGDQFKLNSNRPYNQGGAKEGKIDLQISKSQFLRNMLKCYANVSHEDVRNSFWSPDDI